MSVNIDQLEALITEKSNYSRQVISDISWNDFQHMTNDALTAMDTALRKELLILTTEAQKICDDFYIWQKQMNATRREKDRTNILVRAHLRDNSLTIDWIYQRRRVKKTGAAVCHSTRLAPEAKYRLSANQWKKQPEWIQARIESCEKELAFIRERIAYLALIRKAVRNYKDVIIRTRNSKQKEFDIKALPVPLINPRRIKNPS